MYLAFLALTNMSNPNMVWRSNQKVWMAGILFAKHLQWYDNRMAGRNVILLIDKLDNLGDQGPWSLARLVPADLVPQSPACTMTQRYQALPRLPKY